ncbi:MAG TPA: c-type cytochrome [Verrucomicrobiae bacterium]|nr:c-type cytochrome [Verrucomicrobiae bacterium]
MLSCALSSRAASNVIGLAVTFSAGGKTHTTSLSNVAFYSATCEAPTPFVPRGPFTGVWEGNIHADLRGEFFFQAELNGALKLEINERAVLESSLTDSISALTKPVSLSKGDNKIKAAYTSPQSGHAYLRLLWTEKGTNTSPIPPTVLSHALPDYRLELGRELFIEYRCAKCHQEKLDSLLQSLDAPSLEAIGTRRNTAWMERWILDPHAERPSAHMPKLAKSPEEAKAMAAFLGTLKGGEAAIRPARKDSPPPPEGKTLYDALLCGSCHGETGISLSHAAEKFPPGQLAAYLLAPDAFFPFTRMPNFKLSQKEADTLANELMVGRGVPTEPLPPDQPLIDAGRDLVQSRGCLNCHTLKLENKFKAPKLGTDWVKGCVVGAPAAPQFHFADRERIALVGFGRTERSSLARHIPAEFAERQIRVLNCRACHGQQEGFPPVDILGGKLRPEWMGSFISGAIPYKPRAETHPRGEPWLFARMPAFAQWGQPLATGMSALHGYPPQTSTEKSNSELAKLGQKLVGKEGGFSCVSCHGVGPVQATDVFDSEGVNLAWSAERLLPQYYRRWVRNPLAIDPQTKMPVYFDEDGRSPLTEILDGDAEKQITAMWHYLLMGEKMPRPNLGETQ